MSRQSSWLLASLLLLACNDPPEVASDKTSAQASSSTASSGQCSREYGEAFEVAGNGRTATLTDTRQFLEIDATIPRPSATESYHLLKTQALQWICEFRQADPALLTKSEQTTLGFLDAGEPTDRRYRLSIRHESVRGEKLQGYRLIAESYTGGAHGNYRLRTFTFDAAGKPIGLGDLFTENAFGNGDFLAHLASRVRHTLAGRLGDAWFPEGAQAAPENYHNFTVGKRHLNIEFQPYQVAPWSEGPQTVSIPLEELQPALNRELFPAKSPRRELPTTSQ